MDQLFLLSNFKNDNYLTLNCIYEKSMIFVTQLKVV